MEVAKRRKLKTPYADLLGPLSTEERAALEADIKASGGVRDSVKIDEEDNILDGHNRYAIDKNAPVVVIPGLSESEKEAFVFRSNFVRRNLSPDRKREILKKMKETAKRLKLSDPKKYTQPRIAAALGVNQSTVSRWFDKGGGSNMQPHKASATNGVPDSRVKIDPKQKPVIVERVASGDTQAQIAADFNVSERAIRTVVKSEEKKAKVKAEREEAAKKINGDCGVLHGDFREAGKQIADASVQLVFTDPPYDKECVELYGSLSVFASRVLCPGGWLLAYSGQAHLLDVMNAMSDCGLTYAWTFCCLHGGGDVRFRKYKIHNGWKPIVAFYKPTLAVDWEWFKDVVSGGKEKDSHEWQQAESEAAHFIERLSSSGGFVCDPFTGSGTTLAAAKGLGRKWVGCEANFEHVETARIRLSDEAL